LIVLVVSGEGTHKGYPYKLTYDSILIPMVLPSIVWGRSFLMDDFLATVIPDESGQSATAVPAGHPEPPTQAIAAVPASPGLPGNGLALTIDVTTIATVGLVLAFSYSIVQTFRE